MKNPRLKTCSRCHGTGSVRMVIKPIHGQSEPSSDHMHIVSCPQIGCHNGIVDVNEYYRSMGIKGY
jgi:hypothetical protein